MKAPARILLAVVSAAVVLAAVPAAASDKATGLGRLVGVWQLDNRVSDDPLAMARGARPPAGARARAGVDGDERASLLEERLQPYVEGAGVLNITYDDPDLTIRYWDDHERVLTVDGRKHRVEGPRGTVQVEADWGSSDRLIVKTTGDPAGKIVEVFELGGRGEKLFHTVDLYRKGSRRRFSFQRLYNRVDAAE